MTSEIAVVTGIGIVSALGTGCDAHREALGAGRHGLKSIERFATAGLATTLAGLWPEWSERRQLAVGPNVDLELSAADFPVAELALTAAGEAWRDAGLDRALERGVYRRDRIALLFGTCFGQGFRRFHELAEEVARALGIGGPCITFSTACSSSTNALGLARDLLAQGHADAVLAGGADALLREVFAGFSSLGVLSPACCAPFSEPVGTTLAEGAGFLVVERGDLAARREATARASIHGYGLSADAFHETTPDPSGSGIARAIRGALADAGWRASDVDYVSAHATGTSTNDRTEWMAIERELGKRTEPVLVSGSKSMCGHTQGAAGAVETILAILAMEHGEVPPTLHFRGPRPGCPSDPVASPAARPHVVHHALKISAAFGGANAVLAFGPGYADTTRDPHATETTRAKRSRVVASGIGIVGPCGAFAGAAFTLPGEREIEGRVPDIDLRSVDPTIDPRRLDPSSRYLTIAATLCLTEARRTIRGAARDRAGLFVGASRMPADSARRCRDSIARRGITATSAAAFARMSVNAPAGACAKALGLRGPSTTVSIGEGSGLLAIALAAEWLALRNDADCIVAGAVDEALDGSSATEGAVCVMLERACDTRDRSQPAPPAIFGVGIAAAGNVRAAALCALAGEPLVDGVVGDHESARSCLAPRIADARDLALGFVDVSKLWGRAEASRSTVGFALAVERIRSGSARSLLVTASAGASASVAILLARSEDV